MDFPQAVSSGFSKYLVFSGRSSRSEFWWWVLFAFLVGIAAQILDAIISTAAVLNIVATLGLLLPGLAVAVRRLHDKRKSGWWYLIIAIPLVGAIILIVWFIGEGEAGENRYGPEPM